MDRHTDRQMDRQTDFDTVTLRYTFGIYRSGYMYFHTKNSTDFTALKQFMSKLTLLFLPYAAHIQAPR